MIFSIIIMISHMICSAISSYRHYNWRGNLELLIHAPCYCCLERLLEDCYCKLAEISYDRMICVMFSLTTLWLFSGRALCPSCPAVPLALPMTFWYFWHFWKMSDVQNLAEEDAWSLYSLTGSLCLFRYLKIDLESEMAGSSLMQWASLCCLHTS